MRGEVDHAQFEIGVRPPPLVIDLKFVLAFTCDIVTCFESVTCSSRPIHRSETMLCK